MAYYYLLLDANFETSSGDMIIMFLAAHLGLDSKDIINHLGITSSSSSLTEIQCNQTHRNMPAPRVNAFIGTNYNQLTNIPKYM
jgi:hypothetical protein